MHLLDVFGKNRRSDRLEKHMQAIVNPITPLDLQAYNQHNKGGRPKSLTDSHVIQIMRWKTENISNREISRRLHVSEMTIRRYIKSYTADVHTDTSMPYANDHPKTEICI